MTKQKDLVKRLRTLATLLAKEASDLERKRKLERPIAEITADEWMKIGRERGWITITES